MMHGQQNIKES